MNDKIKDGGPAFPCPETDNYKPQWGMSLRDYFAAKAMQALMPILKHDIDELSEGRNSRAIAISEMAYMYADAILEAREK